MADVPFPLITDDPESFKSQIWELFRQIYEEKIGGADLGDVFGITNDVLTLVLAAASGLSKSGNVLAISPTSDGGIQVTTSGILLKILATGGMETTASGLGISLDGDSLSLSASGLKINASLIDVSALTASRLLATDATKKFVSVPVNTGWSVTNVTADKSYDADTAGCSELADVLGTLINTLISQGLLSA